MSDEFSKAIDDAAHEMTAGEPSRALRARVLARLDNRTASRWVWTLVPIGAAAMIAVLIYAARWQSPVTSRQSADILLPSSAGSFVPPTVESPVAETTVSPVPPFPRSPVPRPSETAEVAGIETTPTEPLEFTGPNIEVPVLEFSPLVSSEINSEPIDVAPLVEISELNVTPLSN